MSFLSLVKAKFGLNPTATDNFVIESTGAGTGRIRKGDLATVGADIITWNAAGVVSQGVAQSMVRVNTANSYGSTNTKIRRFTNVVTNQGSDITYADSATLGASFTINTSGVYAISYNDQFSNTGWLGISLNTTMPTASFTTIPVAEKVCSAITSNANYALLVSSTLYLPAGSVIRAHTNGDGSGGSTADVQFTITRVS